MSFGFGFGLPSWRTLAGGFTPASLFVGGEQGTWYDPSDFSTLFSDTSGTVPVTGIEDVVGRMLDKSGNGNHAIAPIGVGNARPTLRARYNLLTYSEDFSNAAWDKLNGLTVTAGQADPIGGTAAFKVIAPNSTGAGRVLRQALTSGVSGKSYTTSFYAKFVPGEFAWIRVLATDNGLAWFDIQNGVVGTVTAGSATITAIGGGWYRCSYTASATSANIYSYLNPVDADNSSTTTGDGVKGVIAFGCQLLTAADVTATGNAYQRIAAATVYDTSNSVFRPYLAFGGTQDMTIASSANNTFQNVGGGTIWGGFSASGIDQTVVLFSTNPSNTNSRAALFSQIIAARREDAQASATVATNSSFAAVTNYVGTGVFDWSVGTITLRTNGAVSQTSSLPSSGLTSNTTSAALRIGSLASTGNYLTGRIYSLITRGAQSTAAEISATESWVNSRTGAY